MATDPAGGVGVFAALAAGLVSFLSPCVLPLVPGYVSAVTGVGVADLESAGWRRVLVPSLLFIAAFSAIFIALGLASTGVGQALREHRDTLDKVAAVTIALMGVFFLLTPFVARLNREWHVEALLRRARRGGPVVAGAAFAIAWTPCVGPTLAAILSAAALSSSAAHGAMLLGVYSAGLAHRARFQPDNHGLRRHQATLRGDRGRRRCDPDRDGRPDLDRRALPAQRRGAAVPGQAGARLLQRGLTAATQSDG